MLDEPTNVEWFAGRPYAGSDAYIIGRKASPSYRTQSGESANQFLRINSSGQMGLGMTPGRMFEVKDSTNANRIMNIRGTGTSGAFLAFLDANTTDDSKCRIGTKGGNAISIRGDEHYFQDPNGNNRFILDGNGHLAGMGPDGGVPKIINDADVNLGGRYIWNRLQSSNYVTTSASDQFKIAFWRNTADGHVTCYYRGVSVRVYAGGRTDWSSHGYVTHSSEVLLTMSSTTNGRSHVISNQGYSYLQNNSSNMRFAGTTWSYDSNYLYATFRFDTNESGTVWRPYYNVEVIDNDGIVQSVVGV